MAYIEWLSPTAVPPVWEGSKHPPTTLVDPDRYIWYLASTTAITPLNSGLTLGFSKDPVVAPTDPTGAWTYSDQSILQEFTTYNTRSHGGKNLKVGVADLKFTPTDTALHPIIWRFGTQDTSAGVAVSWDGSQAENGVVGDILAYKWKDGVAPFTLKFVKLDGTVLSTQTTSNRSFTMNSTNLPAGNVYVDLYDSNGTYATTKTVLASPSGSISVTNGERLSVQGIFALREDVSVQNGSRMELDGGLPVTAYGNAKTSAGVNIKVIPQFSLSLSAGSDVSVDGRLGASYLQISSPEVKPRYIQDLQNGSYNMYLLRGQHSVDFTTSARPGEPSVDIDDVDVMSGDSVSIQRTGDHTFRLIAGDLGEAQVMIATATGEGQTLINVTVLDEYPDTVLVKNGSAVKLNDAWITVQRKVLLNNNAHDINMDASVVFTGDVEISNGNAVVVSKDFHIFLSAGSQSNVEGYKAIIHYQKVDNGNAVSVDGSVVFTGDVETGSGGITEVVTGHLTPTSNGSTTTLFGWKEQPHNEIIVGGGSVNVTVGQISVQVPEESVSIGLSVNLQGIKPEDIHVANRMVTSVFRGIQIEKDDVVIENPVTITLTGVKEGGNLPDIDVTLLYDQSIVQGREFVKGQITEIPEISLDSYTKLGVKLYSCDNTLLNPAIFASAYFTIGDEVLILANIDAVKSIIDATVSPDTISGLTARRVYDMNLHVVDKQGNPSIVLTRKLRFI